jgi:hypothetical protein
MPQSSQVDFMLIIYSNWSNRMKQGNPDNLVALEMTGFFFTNFQLDL